MDLSALIKDVQSAADAAAASGQLDARNNLLSKVQTLQLAAETPQQTIMKFIYQPIQNSALRLAVEIGLPQAIAAKKGEAITVAELATETGADRTLIARLMRIISALRFCNEVGEEKYSPNTVTEALASPGFLGGVRYLFDNLVPVTGKIQEYFRNNGFQNPEKDNPFEFTHGTSIWDYLKARPSEQQDMVEYMGSRRAGQLRWLDIFPFESVIESHAEVGSDSVLLVDIGGNHGHDLTLFTEKHPDMPGKLILQDLPARVENLPSSLPKSIEAMAYDFFTPQPVKGARVYFFRAICHDWPDPACQRFLSNTVAAMDGASRLLINDIVLPDTGAALMPSSLDYMMMFMVAGIERTEHQWQDLLGSVGLDIVKVWRTPQSVDSVIETRKRMSA